MYFYFYSDTEKLPSHANSLKVIINRNTIFICLSIVRHFNNCYSMRYYCYYHFATIIIIIVIIVIVGYY